MASPGTTWQLPHATGDASPRVAPMCEVWAPTRTASAEFPHVGRGGAPVVLSVPPWHIVQLVFQVAPWHWAQAMVVLPPTPSRFAPWQLWQLARPALAEAAWNPLLFWSIHSSG